MAAVNATPRALPGGVHRIEIAVPYPRHASTSGCSRATPLTLVDAGPANAESLDALEAALEALGHSIEAVELVLLTHHHLDHSGLAGAIAATVGRPRRRDGGHGCVGLELPRAGRRSKRRSDAAFSPRTASRRT